MKIETEGKDDPDRCEIKSTDFRLLKILCDGSSCNALFAQLCV